MKIRHAQPEDFSEILKLYENARLFMAENGNPDQWRNGYPSRETLEQDLQKEQLYVLEENGRLQAVFVYFFGEEPNYRRIENGRWLNDRPYGTVHRITSSAKERGAATYCLSWCYERCRNLRIDTHRANLPMRRMLEKNGFQECGTVKVEDGTERIAYQKTEGEIKDED